MNIGVGYRGMVMYVGTNRRDVYGNMINSHKMRIKMGEGKIVFTVTHNPTHLITDQLNLELCTY